MFKKHEKEGRDNIFPTIPELNALKGCLDIKKNKLCIAKSGFEKMLKSNNFRRNSFIEIKKFSEVKHFIN